MLEETIRFEHFEVIPHRRVLLREGKPQRLGSRAFDLLLCLVGRPGETLSGKDLRAAVWPGIFVEASNLRVHMTELRKALCDDPSAPRFIANLPGRGYCFIAAVERTGIVAIPERDPPPTIRIPQHPGRVIGRDEDIETLARAVSSRQLVSIVGPGGIGKTTVALTVARFVEKRFAQGVAFVDLTAVSDDRMVPAAVASVFGLALRQGDASTALTAYLRGKHQLVVLDNCEQVIDAAARLAETLINVPGIHVLTTSRETLRVGEEWIHRLLPLGLPGEDARMTAAEAMAAPAVELFVERVSARLGGYTLTDSDATVATRICRKLDGLALAIELAAGPAGSMSLRNLDSSLDDCLGILTRGRRTALPRHQTLRATLDWSYQLLPKAEQAVFRRLAVFTGVFTLDAAEVVSSCDEIPVRSVRDHVRSLAEKSLIVPDREKQSESYSLLATSRAFANELLDDAQERDQAARRHANYFRRELELAEAEWETRPTVDWLADYAGNMPNLRAALEWSFAPGGDAACGIALTVAAVPLWFEISQVEECLRWVERALGQDEAVDADRQHRMRLYAVLGWPSMRAISAFPTGSSAWSTALQIAEQIGDKDFQLRALWALWVEQMNGGNPQVALGLANRFCRLEDELNTGEQCIGRRLRARSLHILGRSQEALDEVSGMLASYVAPTTRSHIARFQYDQAITARITKARALWVRGFPEQALREAEAFIADAVSLGHILTLTHALADGACPIALLVGDLGAAERFTELLAQHTLSKALDVWSSYAACFRGELLIRMGDARTGLSLVRTDAAKLERSGFILYRSAFLAAEAFGCSVLRQPDEGLHAIASALDQCDRTGEAWYRPELLRLRGELRLMQGAADVAEISFRLSLTEAEHQGALSWSLRTATSLCRLLQAQDRGQEGIAILEPIYHRFTEGFRMTDLTVAAHLLGAPQPE